jgi:signal transduction histidine kinase
VVAQVLGLFLYRRDAVGFDYREPDAAGLMLAVASVLPLWWRRRYPATVAGVVAVASTATGIAGYALVASTVAVGIAVYTAAVRAPLRRSLAAAVVAAACAAVYTAWLRSATPRPELLDPLTLSVSVLAFLGVWGIGRGVRGRRLYTAELEQRAERLERARAAEVRAALIEERGRIARELHDVVAHHVAVMTVQAAAARRTLDRDPAASAEAMASVEATGRSALAEMRRLVGVMRGPDDAADDATRSPTPGLADLPALVEQLGEAGLPVRLQVEGSPYPLPAGADLAAYRVVQEALTNTLKHAGPASAEVVLQWTPQRLVLDVADSGHGPRVRDAAGDEDRPGHGLLGMRERLALYGGQVRTGPAPGGGFRVRAELPVEGLAG